MTHIFAFRSSHVASFIAIIGLAIVLSSCVRQRDIFAPVPGALERTVPDTSITAVLNAASLALTDLGLTVAQVDRENGVVESAYVDITAVRTDIDPNTAIGIERNVRFRFRAIPSFGAISVYGEAVYMLGDFGGRAAERMVPEQHPARQVLEEMLTSIEERVAQTKAERAPPPPDR